MADKKISEFPTLLQNQVNITTDVIPIVTPSDVIKNKKITVDALVSSAVSGLGLVSSSAQINALGNLSASFVEYTNVANVPTLISASSQVSYSGLTGTPAGIVSASSQVSYSGLTGTPAGIVSASSQINTGSFTGSFTGTFTGAFAGAFVLGGVLSPTALSSNTNDYNPVGLSTANFLRISATTNISLTGLRAPSPTASQVLFIVNVGTGNINMLNNNPGSSAANRFYMNNDRLLNNGEGVILVYDTISLGWRCVAFQV